MLIDVIGCKSFRSPHQHGTDRTVIYSDAGTSLGSRFEVCPFTTLRAKDAALETFRRINPNTHRIHAVSQPKEPK